MRRKRTIAIVVRVTMTITRAHSIFSGLIDREDHMSASALAMFRRAMYCKIMIRAHHGLCICLSYIQWCHEVYHAWVLKVWDRDHRR